MWWLVIGIELAMGYVVARVCVFYNDELFYVGMTVALTFLGAEV